MGSIVSQDDINTHGIFLPKEILGGRKGRRDNIRIFWANMQKASNNQNIVKQLTSGYIDYLADKLNRISLKLCFCVQQESDLAKIFLTNKMSDLLKVYFKKLSNLSPKNDQEIIIYELFDHLEEEYINKHQPQVFEKKN